MTVFHTTVQGQGSLADQLGIVPLEKCLQQLINRAPVMLFMKGTPEVRNAVV